MEVGLTWVDLLAKHRALPGLHEVAYDNKVVIELNLLFFQFTHPFAQVEGLSDIFCRQCSFTESLIRAAHQVVSRSEIRVELNCSLTKSHRCGSVALETNSLSPKVKACNAS